MFTQAVSKASCEPIYKQIKQSIMRQVTAGRLEPGAAIPSENELAGRYEISRMTVRKAIEELAREGIVVRVPGKGSFVAPAVTVLELSRLRSFTEEAERRGLRPGAQILRAEVVEPDAQVAQALKLAPGEKVLELERVRTMNAIPASLSVSRFPLSLCAALLGLNLDNQSVYRLLEGQLGLKLGWGRETIGCCNATKYVARVLQIRPGTAVIASDRQVFLEDGTPIDYLNAYTRSDLFKLRFDVKR